MFTCMLLATAICFNLHKTVFSSFLRHKYFFSSLFALSQLLYSLSLECDDAVDDDDDDAYCAHPLKTEIPLVDFIAL